MIKNENGINAIKDNLITSVSGWRKIFSTSVSGVDYALVFYAVRAYLDTMAAVWEPESDAIIAVGRDSRETGLGLSQAVLHAMHTHPACADVKIVYLGIISLPHIMSFARARARGFVYITASHNPPEYNGIKFGNQNGAVADRDIALKIIDTFFSQYAPRITQEHAGMLMERTSSERPAAQRDNRHSAPHHTNAQSDYARTLYEAVFRGLCADDTGIEQTAAALQNKVAEQQAVTGAALGIVWDVNGGARCGKFDEWFLKSLDIPMRRIHTDAGVFAHEIIPEGHALEDARRELITMNNRRGTRNHEAQKSLPALYPLAVTSDCDGDRGNVVFYTPPDAGSEANGKHSVPGQTAALTAQEGFALVLEIELAWQRFIATKHPARYSQKCAVVINGPSTARCEHIARAYGCEVFRVEVGEANVVNKAEQLRAEGYVVPLVGEASNGGIIMHPSTVRDPLCTVLSCLKALLWRETLWSDNTAVYDKFDKRPEHTLAVLYQNLPPGATTEVEDSLAKFVLPSDVPVEQSLQRIVRHARSNTGRLLNVLQQHGIHAERVVCSNFTGTQSNCQNVETIDHNDIRAGGVGLYFYADDAFDALLCAFVWIRPSGTEPVVRVVADVVMPSDGENIHARARDAERALIHAWRAMLEAALG